MIVAEFRIYTYCNEQELKLESVSTFGVNLDLEALLNRSL